MDLVGFSRDIPPNMASKGYRDVLGDDSEKNHSEVFFWDWGLPKNGTSMSRILEVGCKIRKIIVI